MRHGNFDAIPMPHISKYNHGRQTHGAFMTNPFILMSDDPILETLNFKPYRNMTLRRVTPFLPAEDEPQSMEVATSWGAKLKVEKGDFLISELDKADDMWPIDASIFDETYIITAPGLCVKRATTLLVPMTDLTNGDENQQVTVQTMEGPVTVRAGDFFLAKGVKGEIWPYPKEKAQKIMKPA